MVKKTIGPKMRVSVEGKSFIQDDSAKNTIVVWWNEEDSAL